MKKGISVWSFPADWNLSQIFRTAKDAGFEGVEVALAETGEINLSSTQEDMERVKELANQNGIRLYSVASGLYWTYSLTSEKEDVREKAKSIVRKQLQVAKWLECDTILVVPGTVGADFIEGCEVVDYEEAYNRAFDSMNELKHEAERLQVSIGLENVWNKFLISPLEMRDFIDKIGSNYVGAYFDVGNVIYSGYPEQWIRILGNRIRKVHFKDFRRDVGNINGFVDLLAGDVNYPEVLKALKAIGYDGWVTAEMGLYNNYPEQVVYNTANTMGRILMC